MSWKPEDHLPADPNARPDEGDIAGWARFYAWGYEDAYGESVAWGDGQGDYGGGCRDCFLQEVADEIDRLNALLGT